MSDGASILVIEDDPILGPAMVQRLRLEGYAPILAADGATALRVLDTQTPRAVISDIRLPDMSGEEVFTRTLERAGLVPTFFVTAFGDISQAIRLVKAGAKDYLTKPVDIDALLGRLGDVCAEPVEPERQPVLGRAPSMQALETLLRRVAPLDLPVLLLGESGVGKEVAARFLHSLSAGDAKPFVAVNCSAIPRDLAESILFGHERGAFTGAIAPRDGLFEQARDGILFLDEIGELPLELQPKLLRVIQEGRFLPVGARAEKSFAGRIVCATHNDLSAAMREGRFREDLYYRINVVEVTIPPLRDRVEDIPALAKGFLAQAARRFGLPERRLDQAGLEAMQAYDWPGNVRELRNRMERAAALSDTETLTLADIFPEDRIAREPDDADGDGLEDAVEGATKRRIEAALREAEGNKTEAARLLKISRTTLWKKIRQLGISVRGAKQD